MQKAKVDYLKDNYGEMIMKEWENISKYYSRTNKIITTIKGARCKILIEEVVSKVFVILLPWYAIRASSIQEMKSIKCDNLALYWLVWKITTF